jgi:hypothetical protein
MDFKRCWHRGSLEPHARERARRSLLSYSCPPSPSFLNVSRELQSRAEMDLGLKTLGVTCVFVVRANAIVSLLSGINPQGARALDIFTRFE